MGAFNTIPQKFYLFNKPCDWTFERFINSEGYKILCWVCRTPIVSLDDNVKTIGDAYVGLSANDVSEEEVYAERQKRWSELSKTEKRYVKALPNFDVKMFKECTGIDVN